MSEKKVAKKVANAVEKPVKHEAPSNAVTFSAELAACILRAGTTPAGYANTTGSEHATKVGEGRVRVEFVESGERKSVVVGIPDTYTFFAETD